MAGMAIDQNWLLDVLESVATLLNNPNEENSAEQRNFILGEIELIMAVAGRGDNPNPFTQIIVEAE